MGIKLDSDTFFSKKVLIPLGVIAVVAIIIIIMVLSGNKKSPLEDVFRLNARLTNLSNTINNYKGALKSSDLRSTSSSLANILTSTSSAVTPLTATDEYKKLSKSATEQISAEETEQSNTLNTTLENAKLNATLDRTYAREMSYQVYQLIQLEQSTKETTNDESLKTALDSSINNLNASYNDLSNF